MTQYNTLNVKLSNSQLNKSKSGIKTGTEVTLNPSSNLIRNSNDETNFSHKIIIDWHKFQRFVTFSLIVHQLIQNFQELICLRSYN